VSQKCRSGGARHPEDFAQAGLDPLCVPGTAAVGKSSELRSLPHPAAAHRRRKHIATTGHLRAVYQSAQVGTAMNGPIRASTHGDGSAQLCRLAGARTSASRPCTVNPAGAA